MYKFEIGQKVIFHQGQAAKRVNAPEKVEAIVYQRDNEVSPIYQIKWGSVSKASVSEKELTAA